MKKIKTVLPMLLSISLLIFLFFKVDFHEVRAALKQVHEGYFLLAVFFSIFAMYWPSLMMSLLLRYIGITRSSWQVLRINFESIYYAMVVPADVAAGVVRCHRLTQSPGAVLSHRITDGLTVMLCERFFHVLTLILFLCGLAPYTSPVIEKWSSLFWWWSMVILTAVLVLIILARVLPSFRNKNNAARSLPQSIFKKIESNFLILVKLPWSLLLTLVALIIVCQLINLLAVDALLLVSTGMKMPLIDFLFLATLVRLARFVPLSWSGIGVREGIMGWGMMFYGFSFEQGVLIGLLGTIQLFLLALMGGGLELARHFQLAKNRTPSSSGPNKI